MEYFQTKADGRKAKKKTAKKKAALRKETIAESPLKKIVFLRGETIEGSLPKKKAVSKGPLGIEEGAPQARYWKPGPLKSLLMMKTLLMIGVSVTSTTRWSGITILSTCLWKNLWRHIRVLRWGILWLVYLPTSTSLSVRPSEMPESSLASLCAGSPTSLSLPPNL